MSTPLASGFAHAAAFHQRLIDGLDELGVRGSGAYEVYRSRVPGNAVVVFPYLVVHPDPGGHTSERITREFERFDQAVQVTVVGRNQDEVLAAAFLAQQVLLGRRLAVAGRDSWKVRQIPGTPTAPLVDRSANDPFSGEPVLILPLLFGVASTPSTS